MTIRFYQRPNIYCANWWPKLPHLGTTTTFELVTNYTT